MTPLEIEILLHYHCRANDYLDGDTSASAVGKAITTFKMEHMLEENLFEQRKYRLTDRGQFFVDHILALGMPEANWSLPKAG